LNPLEFLLLLDFLACRLGFLLGSSSGFLSSLLFRSLGFLSSLLFSLLGVLGSLFLSLLGGGCSSSVSLCLLLSLLGFLFSSGSGSGFLFSGSGFLLQPSLPSWQSASLAAFSAAVSEHPCSGFSSAF